MAWRGAPRLREIDRDRAARSEIARDRAILQHLGTRRGGWVGSEGAQVCSAVDGESSGRVSQGVGRREATTAEL